MSIQNPSLPLVPAGLQVRSVVVDGVQLLITATPTATGAACPACGGVTAGVHDRRWRKIADLPWHDRAVLWRVQVRRFRCRRCSGRVFTEPLPALAGTRVRRSDRLAQAQTSMGMALGGEAGARLSYRLFMPVSGDTVLRLIRRSPLPPMPAPRVIGIDDWAWRRGRHYGTIVCDLERRRVIDLLPGRSSKPVARWLAAHLGIAVVSRDRAGPYADAARTGAPGAIQVADRWHLLVNASDALRHVVERHQPQVREAVRFCTPSASPASHPRTPLPTPGAAPAVSSPSRRHARFEVVHRLHADGVPIKQIVRQTGVARNAVRRWLRACELIPYRRAPAPSLLNRHQPFLEERWLAGERRSTDLHRALEARGFEGGYDIVRRWAARRRAATAVTQVLPSHIPSARRTTRLLKAQPSSLNQAERRFVEALEKAAPDLRIAADLVRDFGILLKQNDPAGLDPWLMAAAKTGLRGFARGVRQDQAAVEAAIAQPWSNGQVEGQNNRLKLIKRSMYGRAGFDLLRQRVLQAA